MGLVAIRRDGEKSSGPSSGPPSRVPGRLGLLDDDRPSGWVAGCLWALRSPPHGGSSGGSACPPESREGRPEDFPGSPQRQNSDSPMDDNLALVEVFL
jgi:hypothetical protein